MSRRVALRRAAWSMLGLAAAPRLPFAQPARRVLKLGMLLPTSPPVDGQNATTLIPIALERLGYRAGRDLLVEKRFAEGRPERLDALAAGLVQWGADAIVPVGLQAIRAARRATTTTPIVFYGNFDPHRGRRRGKFGPPGRQRYRCTDRTRRDPGRQTT